MLKILHTSDWHLGARLYGNPRYEEHQLFLDWLLDEITTQKIELLLIAGDIFDTPLPSNKSQEQYYKFLAQCSLSTCNNIVVIGGNHDSPTFLDAPKALLSSLKVHVVGKATEQVQDEIVRIYDTKDNIEALVCAVPFLRDRDIRKVEEDESIQGKDHKLIQGIQQHYEDVTNAAIELKKESKLQCPIIGMGHLFVTGGKVGEGVRDLYIGSLGQIRDHIFPNSLDYVALGHLHIQQKVGAKNHIRYSGSPIPMSFAEAEQNKFVLVLELEEQLKPVQEVQVPNFQKLKQIKGDLETIQKELNELQMKKEAVWIEVIYESDTLISDLQNIIQDLVKDSLLEVIRVKNNSVYNQVLKKTEKLKSLDDLTPLEVFQSCLDSNSIPTEQQTILKETFKEAYSLTK